MLHHFRSVERHVERWRTAGLIDAETAAALLHDLETRDWRPSLGMALAILAAASLGAALILLVAANWEAFPRLLRVAGIFSVILGGYVGGAALKLRGAHAVAEALWLLGAVGFGAGIALIAQMYHLSGDERQALLLWCGGTALAAAMLRSRALTVGAVLLAAAWLVAGIGGSRGSSEAVPLSFLAVAAGLWALSLWTRSRAARNMIMLSLMLFALLHHLETESLVMPVLLSGLSTGLFALALYARDFAGSHVRLGNETVHGLLGFLVGMWTLHIPFSDGWPFGLVAAIVLAGLVAALIAGGRGNAALRRLVYVGFSIELWLVFVMLLDTMLDTAGFFFAAGLAIASLAWMIGRLEKRQGGEGVKP